MPSHLGSTLITPSSAPPVVPPPVMPRSPLELAPLFDVEPSSSSSLNLLSPADAVQAAAMQAATAMVRGWVSHVFFVRIAIPQNRERRLKIF